MPPSAEATDASVAGGRPGICVTERFQVREVISNTAKEGLRNNVNGQHAGAARSSTWIACCKMQVCEHTLSAINVLDANST